jgi:hypothetical protein
MSSPSTRSQYSTKNDEQLMALLWGEDIADDPLAFVMAVFPWGQPNTALAHYKGPRKWQVDELTKMRDHIRMNKERMKNKQEPLVYKSAAASGRGTGKSALVAWLNLWMLSTRLGATCINTANTEAQLKSRTWAELGKWHTLSINAHWFDRTATKMVAMPWFEKALKQQLKVDTGYYYAEAQLWSEEKPDAFAGAHNHYGMLVIFDEASGIPEAIWSVTEGFFTEPILHRYWFCFSNPRRNTGAFFECFHKHRNFWQRRHIDSRTVEGVDKGVLQSIVDKYGEDSDQARVEVKGEFPRQGDKQFISREIIDGAITREVVEDHYAPLMMGVDPARYGDDCTVIRFRQGRNARVIPPVKLKGADNMRVANECADLIQRYNPDAVCIDAGNGTGIIDRLREMGFKVHEVWFGSKSEDPEWSNKRTELWARMRDWLGGGCIDNDEDLIDDLSTPEYTFQTGSDKMRLETKEELKRKGFASPDNADALACTFAVKVARKDLTTVRGRGTRQAKDVDYNLF